MDWVPEIALVPVQDPEAVHEVAPVELQVSVEAEPEDMVVGLVVRESVGGDAVVLAFMAVDLGDSLPALS